MPYTIWTDGSSLGNPGPIGWGYVIKNPEKPPVFGGSSYPYGAANYAETKAILEAIKHLPPNATATVISDSKWAIKRLEGTIRMFKYVRIKEELDKRVKAYKLTLTFRWEPRLSSPELLLADQLAREEARNEQAR